MPIRLVNQLCIGMPQLDSDGSSINTLIEEEARAEVPQLVKSDLRPSGQSLGWTPIAVQAALSDDLLALIGEDQLVVQPGQSLISCSSLRQERNSTLLATFGQLNFARVFIQLPLNMDLVAL